MMKFLLAAGLFVCASAFAAMPSISGGWSGSVKGQNFHTEYNGSENVTRIDKINAKSTLFLTMSGDNLTGHLEVLNSDGTRFRGDLSGKVGNFSFWMTGTGKDDDPESGTEILVLAGHVATKGNKIVGQGVAYGKNLTEITFSMKPDSNVTAPAGVVAAAEASKPGLRDEPEGPFNVSGKASGKSYSLTGSSKAAKFSAAVTGTITPVSQAADTAVMTFTAGGETFQFTMTDNNFDYDKTIFFIGSGNSSKTCVFYGKASNTSAAGNFVIYSNDKLIEGKMQVKKQ